MIDHLVDCRRDVKEPISRRREDAARFQQSFHFGIKTVEIKPMQRLRHHDEINGARFEPAFFPGRDAIFHTLVWLGVCDLLLARVRRDNAIECFRQLNCGLTISRCAIPRQRATPCNSAEIFKHLARITRPKLRVIRRLLRKMILETHPYSAILLRPSLCRRASAATGSNVTLPAGWASSLAPHGRGTRRLATNRFPRPRRSCEKYPSTKLPLVARARTLRG